MRWSLRYRLLGPMAFLLLGTIGISIWTAFAAVESAEQRIDRHAQSVADTLAQSSFPLTEPVLRQIRGLSGAEYLLIDEQGERLSTFADAEFNASDHRAIVTASEMDPLSPTLVHIHGREYRCQRVRLSSRNDRKTLLVFFPEEVRREAIRDAIRPSIVFGLFGGSMALLMTLGIGRRLVRSIRDLERHTRQIAAGNFSPMPLPRVNDELLDLSQSVNEMAKQLAQFQDTVRKTEQFRLVGQLSSGLAHQLRNNVAGARLAIQVHAEELSEPSEAVDVALRQLSLMDAHLSRFLSLSRTGVVQLEPIHLGQLIDEALVLFKPQCRHAKIALHWQRPSASGEPTLLGDPVQLRHLIMNLLTNAVEAAGPGGAVEVRLLTDTEKWMLEVIDTGPGPPAEIASAIFEPFVTGKTEGIGLGLVVARQAVEAHGGKIAWSRQQERTVFRVELPFTPPPATGATLEATFHVHRPHLQTTRNGKNQQP